MMKEQFGAKEIVQPDNVEHNKPMELPDDSGRYWSETELPDDRNPESTNFKELPRNAEYESNGYLYKTDDKGRIVSAEGTLHMKDREGRLPISVSIEQIGRGDQRSDDDRGHLIGDHFGGSNKMDNLVPLNKDLNRGDYLAMEREMADAVKDGKTVYFKVEPRYEGESARPSMFKATAIIDGEKSVRYFENEGE